MIGSNRDAGISTADGLNFPSPRDFMLLGRRIVLPEAALFHDWKAALDVRGQAAILDRYRETFGIAGNEDVAVRTPALPVPVTVGAQLLNHVFSERNGRFGADSDHVMYSPLAVETLANPDEIWFGRDEMNPVGYKFLRLYTVQAARGLDYVYHLAIVSSDGRVVTAYRLRGGEDAFNGKRRGRVIWAAYL